MEEKNREQRLYKEELSRKKEISQVNLTFYSKIIMFELMEGAYQTLGQLAGMFLNVSFNFLRDSLHHV